MANTIANADLEETSAEKKVRVQLDFEPEDLETINHMKQCLGLSTRAELFRSGIRALRWMALKQEQGCTVVAITPESRFLEPEFDFLEKTRHKASRRTLSMPAIPKEQLVKHG